MKIEIEHNVIHFGDYLKVSFKRTIRIPEDGKDYPLPANLGTFPLYKIADYWKTVPQEWIEKGGGIFIPMYLSEAMWINLDGEKWHPNAIKIGIGGVNIINGQLWKPTVLAEENDYLVSPPQPWIDGIYVGKDIVRQFVTTLPGSGESLETKIKGMDENKAIQVAVFDAAKGKFPDSNPESNILYQGQSETAYEAEQVNQVRSGHPQDLVLAPGGRIKQKLYEDPFGLLTWDNTSIGQLNVFIIRAEDFYKITGKLPPPSPITFNVARELGITWYKIYDDEYSSIKSAGINL